jgi:hypothetical protein
LPALSSVSGLELTQPTTKHASKTDRIDPPAPRRSAAYSMPRGVIHGFMSGSRRGELAHARGEKPLCAFKQEGRKRGLKLAKVALHSRADYEPVALAAGATRRG